MPTVPIDQPYSTEPPRPVEPARPVSALRIRLIIEVSLLVILFGVLIWLIFTKVLV